MADKKIEYDIRVDASDGVRGLREFSRAAKQAGQDAEKGLEESASAADKARGAIGKLTSAFGGVAERFGGLGRLAGPGGIIGGMAAGLLAATKQAGELAIQADQIAQFTGASVEEASALGAVLADNTNVEMNDLLDIVAQMNGVFATSPELADQLGINLADAKNPLDLLITTIDALNSGQLTAAERLQAGAQIFGEEGVRQVNELVSRIDGPLREAIEGVAEERILTDADVESARNVQQAFTDLQAKLQEIVVEIGTRMLPLLEKAADLADLLPEGPTPSEDFQNTILFLKEFGDTWEEIRQAVVDSDEEFQQSVAQGLRPFVDVIADVADEMPEAVVPVKELAEEAKAAGIETGKAAEKIDDRFNPAIREAAEAAAEMSDALRDAVFQTTAAQERVDGWDRAVAKLRELSDLDTATQLGAIADGVDGITDAFKEAGGAAAGADLVPESLGEILGQPDEIRAITDQIAGLADVVNTQLSEAFEFGGAQGLRRAADDLQQQLIPQLEEAGLTAQQIDDVMTAIGATDEQVDIRIRLAGEEQARITLEQMQGVISGLSEEVQLEIAAKFVSDPVAALRLAISELEKQGVEIPAVLTARLEQFEEETGAARDEAEATPVEIPVTADTLPATRKIERDVVRKKRLAVIDTEANTAAAAAALDGLKNDKAKGGPRVAQIRADALVEVANIVLALAARPRTAPITADAQTAAAENELDRLERDRFVDVYIRTHGAAAASASIPGNAVPNAAPSVASARGLAAASPVVVQSAPASVTIQAAVIGNRFEVQRAVTRALRQSQRLNGVRVA